MIVPAFLFTIFACCVCAFRSMPPEKCEVRVRTSEGVACGRVRIAEQRYPYASFRGIPYGKPPLGKGRFAPLEPVHPWAYCLDATEDGPECPQKQLIYGRMMSSPRGQSEDCIYLNVHVPLEDFPQGPTSIDAKGLPILVMVHGGGFQSGSGLSDVHGPEYLMTERVIVITLNFRINVFGYLSLGTKKIPGNQALRDCLSALRWVQRNARAFGGDPNNVTLMGQSAGASTVHLLSLSKAADGLFQRVIMMSGHAIPIYFASNPEFATEIATLFFGLLGINSTDPDYIHEALIKMPLEDLMYANSVVQYQTGLTSFVPVEETTTFEDVETIIDGVLLDLIAQGRGSQYPMLFGFTSNESEFFKWVMYISQILERIQTKPSLTLPLRLTYNFPDDIGELANRTVERCFNGNYTLDNLVNCYNNLFFKYPILKLAQWRALGGAPAYLYKYSYESQNSVIKKALWTTYRGAAHVEDMTYVYRTNSMLGDYVSFPPKNDDDYMKLWWVKTVTNFMKCSNPTCTVDETEWPPVNSTLLYQDIFQPMRYNMKSPDDEELDWVQFFDEVDYQVSNVTTTLKKNLQK